jgi:chorismate-pyruvate lyase
MTTTGRSSTGTEVDARLLYPLDDFYDRAGLIVPPFVVVAGEAVPQPYRQLLVHEDDMTPTLERHHGERIHLRVIGRQLNGDSLSRLVVLTLNDSLKPVEFGAIVIHLEHFPAEAREAILECRRPLGTILADYAVRHASRPRAFLRVSSDPLIKGAMELTGAEPLYGRRNQLFTADDRVLADVVEILPP